MKMNFKGNLGLRFRLRGVLIVTVLVFLVSGILFILFNLGPKKESVAATTDKTLTVGSYIVNMGVTSQTYQNGLLPYGLIYDLIVNHQVPVIWAINPAKLKDGVDFTHNGISYKGGPFIIESGFIDSTVSAVIDSWESQGVIGDYTVSQFFVPVNQTLTSFPKVMIDTTSSLQEILIAYFNNASIPAQAYDLGTPSYLTSCHDVWANPHGDPVWATHSYLYDFVRVQKSWIWAQCHSVSMLESCKSTIVPIKQLNFLTNSGLKCWGNNKCTSTPESHVKSPAGPYSYYFPTDPYMQFMGNMHNACQGGSEQWFQPLSSGAWRSTTRRGVTTGTGVNPNEGTVLVYGPAYGDSTNGWVMYEGGHSLDSGGNSQTDRIAGQRAFLNFLLRAGVAKRLNITATMAGLLAAGQSTIATATVLQGSPPYTYEWSSKLGGTFSSPTTAITQYTAPTVSDYTTDIVRIKVTDACGRVNFITLYVNVGKAETLPVSLVVFKGESKKNHVILRWETASEINNDYFTVSSSVDGIKFDRIGTVRGKGNTTELNKYSFIDNDPFEVQTYYKLSQTDMDGESEEFPMIIVKSKQKNPLDIVTFPNPFDKKLNLIVNAEMDMKISIQLYSTTGLVVFDENYKVTKGANSILVDSEKISPGCYYLNLYSSLGGEKITQKVFKK